MLVPPDLVSHRRQFPKNLEMQILGAVVEALRLLEKADSNIPKWLIGLFALRHFDRFSTE